MAAALYIVALPPGNIQIPCVNGSDALVIQANSAGEATALAQAFQAGGVGGNGSAWNSTNALPGTTPTAAQLDLRGWTIKAVIGTLGSVAYTGVAGDTLFTFMTNLAAAINSAGLGISGAKYANGTLTTAASTDNVGNQTVTITMASPVDSQPTPPGTWPTNFTQSPSFTPAFLSQGPNAFTWQQSTVVGAVTNGAASTASSVAITSTWGIPGVVLDGKLRVQQSSTLTPGVTIVN